MADIVEQGGDLFVETGADAADDEKGADGVFEAGDFGG